jgi:hypothetical protein
VCGGKNLTPKSTLKSFILFLMTTYQSSEYVKGESIMEDVRLILSALWVAVTFCSVFEAILGFVKPGYLKGVMAGEIDGIRVTQVVLVARAHRVECSWV